MFSLLTFAVQKKFIVSYGYLQYMRKYRVGLVVCVCGVGGGGRVVKKKPWQKDWPGPGGPV
jgi:hypothetical protein